MMLLVLSVTSRAQVISQVIIKPKPFKNTEISKTVSSEKSDGSLTVLESIKKEFPDPVVRTLTTIPAEEYGREWNVYISKESAEETPDYYEVVIRTNNGMRTAVYDRSGNLLRVKQVIKNVDLPETIRESLHKKYKGWQIIGEEERITNAKKHVLDYKVKLKKGLLRKTVFIAPDGTIARELPL